MKHYEFDLYELEESALQAYYKFKEESTQKTRSALFVGIRDLAYAMLKVGNPVKFRYDSERASYEYALYLYERIVSNNFELVGYKDRFPLQHYMRLNLRYILFKFRDELEVKDNFYYDEEDDYDPFQAIEKNNYEDMEINFNKNNFIDEIMDTMRTLYSEDEIERLYPLAKELFYAGSFYLIPQYAPDDIKDFLITFVAIAKKVDKNYGKMDRSVCHSGLKRLEEKISGSVRSTIFLSTVANSDIIDKSLLLSLDIDSLYRLVSVAGGLTIKIPNQRELDSIIGTAVTISEMVLNDCDIEEGLAKAKDEYSLVMSSNINIRKFINRIIETTRIDNIEKETEPLINIVYSSIKMIEDLFEEIRKKSDDLSDLALLDYFSEMMRSLTSITQTMHTIEQNMKQ